MHVKRDATLGSVSAIGKAAQIRSQGRVSLLVRVLFALEYFDRIDGPLI